MSRKTDLAWAAGIIDGEGTIGISPINNRYVAKRKVYRIYSLRIAVSNTDPRMLIKLSNLFGGTVYEINTPKTNRRVWKWALAARKAHNVLEQILPYLVNKKDQADLALSFRKVLRRQGFLCKKGLGKARQINETNKRKQETIWQQLKDIKREQHEILQ